MEWYDKFPSRWQQEQVIGKRFLEGMRIDLDAQRRMFLAGLFTVRSQHGQEYGPFRVRIVYPSHFPENGRVPSVYLDSHHDRWTKGRDSHIEPDWRLCLFVPGESGIDFTQRDSLTDLFLCLHTFLIKERIYQRDLLREQATGIPATWPGKARAHGVAGLRQAIRDRGGMGRNEPCVCGSGKKFKKCCMNKKEV